MTFAMTFKNSLHLSLHRKKSIMGLNFTYFVMMKMMPLQCFKYFLQIIHNNNEAKINWINNEENKQSGDGSKTIILGCGSINRQHTMKHKHFLISWLLEDSVNWTKITHTLYMLNSTYDVIDCFINKWMSATTHTA